MSIAKRHAFLVAAASEVAQDVPGTTFEIIAKPSGFRVLIESKNIKAGFATPLNVKANDFVKQFRSEIEKIEKRIQPRAGGL